MYDERALPTNKTKPEEKSTANKSVIYDEVLSTGNPALVGAGAILMRHRFQLLKLAFRILIQPINLLPELWIRIQ